MDPVDRSEIAFFDVETTVPKRGERFAILEFGSILVCPKKLTELQSYTTLVQPADLSLISTLSVRCNGISRNDVVLAPLFSDIADTVFDILHGRIWAGHNILRFDCARIREAFAEIGRQPPEPKGAIDSLALLTQRFGRRAGDMKMATLASYFGLGKQTHRSLDDVRMNLEVLKYCATVLFLESSLPDVLVDKSVSPSETTSLRRHLRASSSGVDNTVITPFTLPSIGENSVAQPDPFNMSFLRNEMASDNNLQLDTLMEEEEEENQPSDTVVVSANTSDHEGFLSPDAISLSNIRAVLVPFYHGSQLMRLKLLHGDSSPLQLYCSCLKIRFGISGKFLDNSGRRRLNFVVDLNSRLCSILEACDSSAQKVSVDSGSSSDWNTVVSPVKGFVNCPNARIHIPTEISGDAARYAIEVHQRESGGDTQKLIFSNPSAEELESLLKQGSVVDAFLSLEPYDYQQKAGVRLVAKKLVMHS
ncbi:protein NEN1 [Brassica rapa]|uniref:Exonuclease domain-containing protein n=1 Tax=Brassica campestris TaxID=3711 RepID=M4CYE6_BRACM|nr:protein NEN1 [Brassica rapa]